MSAKLPSVMYLPSRMMVTRSTMCCSSSSRWLMYTMPLPSSLSWRMMRNISSISFSVSAEVGSSMMRIRALVDSALAISTICCMETFRLPTIVVGSRWMDRDFRILPASSFISRWERTRPFFFSRPRNMFSATVRCWHMFSS